jgi:hypothetical protein
MGFFLFSFVICFALGIIHSVLFSVDTHTSTLVKSITRMAGVPRREIAWVTGNSKEFKLHLCTSIPFGKGTNFCITIFDSRQSDLSIPVPAGFRRSVRAQPRSYPDTSLTNTSMQADNVRIFHLMIEMRIEICAFKTSILHLNALREAVMHPSYNSSGTNIMFTLPSSTCSRRSPLQGILMASTCRWLMKQRYFSMCNVLACLYTLSSSLSFS